MIAKNRAQLKAWIKNMSAEVDVNENVILQNYMLERLLERISVSNYKYKFVLKGGMLITAIVGIDMRNTLDMDATIKGFDLEKDNLENILNEIFNIDLDDGVIFEFRNIKEIRQEDEYGGYRVSLDAKFDKLVVPMKLDITTGDVLQGKTYTTDPISHRRVVNMGEENQYYIAEHHEPIISERMFNQAQEILQKRGGVRGSGRRKGNFSRKYPFSSRLYCGFCGSLLTRRNWHSGTKNSITVWHCMEFVKHGKENCPYCKAMKESIIEEAFTESYKLLCNNNKELIQTFLSEMEEIIQEESNESSIKRLEEEKQILKEKIEKLIDLNLNGTISLETLQEKKAKLQNKINSIEEDQEHLQLELEDSISLNQGLNKFKTLFKDNEIMLEFDKDVFELIIDKVIIGEKEEDGTMNPRVITFILKSGNEIKCKEDEKRIKNQQSSYEVSENYLQKASEPCGISSSATTKERYVLDENGNKTGEILTREQIHKKGLCHRIVVIAIIDAQGNILMQQRSKNKAKNPGKWDVAAAGHVSSGQTSTEAAIRETLEEVGIKVNEQELEYVFTYKNRENIEEDYIDNQICDCYIIKRDKIDLKDIKMQESEVEQVKLCNLEEFNQIIENGNIMERDEFYKKL